MGCKLTPTNTYLHLLKTLYGLKRSPRYWYKTANKVLMNIGLTLCANTPCLYSGTLIKGKSPLYLGIYVDGFTYFSQDKVEQKFEAALKLLLDVEFSGQPQYFLDLKVKIQNHNNIQNIFLSQQSTSLELIDGVGLSNIAATSNATPYRAGFLIHKIKEDIILPQHNKKKIEDDLRPYVGSLNWLSISTRPDLSIIKNMLSIYLYKATPSHITTTKCVIKYLKGSVNFGIMFSSENQVNLEAFIKFTTNPNTLVSFGDTNWGFTRCVRSKSIYYITSLAINQVKINIWISHLTWWSHILAIQTTNNYSTWYYRSRSLCY